MTPVDLCAELAAAIGTGDANRVEHALREMSRAELRLTAVPPVHPGGVRVNVRDLAEAIVTGADRYADRVEASAAACRGEVPL